MTLLFYRNRLGLFGLSLFCFSSVSFGTCEIKDPATLIDALKSKHPAIAANNLDLKKAKSESLLTTKNLNPELSTNFMTGDSVDGKTKKLSISLLQPFELGNKRGLKSRISELNYLKEDATTTDNNEDIAIDAILKSYKLRQVLDLHPLYQEAFETFKKILKIKNNQGSLSPEEIVERETLELVSGDYSLKLSMLESLQDDLERHLSFYIGKDCKISKSILPSITDLSYSANDLNYKKSAKYKAAAYELESSKENLTLENREFIPNIKIGPSFEVEKLEGKSFNSVGVSLSMDLPLWGNKKGVINGENAITSSSAKLINIEEDSKLDLENWKLKYKNYSRSFKNISNQDELEKKHHRIEKLFERGVISTSMIIESHRQLLEFANTRFEFELGTVESLLNINKLNGTLLNNEL